MFHVKQFYPVVVVGGGHAGCEAALACSRRGIETLLVTLKRDKIAEMSCNPSIGGVGKGQLVKELDALGGEMGRNADYTGIQFKRLNTRKGSAVQSSRCQSDKKLYAHRMQQVIAATASLNVLEGEVKGLRVEHGRVLALLVLSAQGLQEIGCQSLVITTGTFMRAVMHCGGQMTSGGRYGEAASFGLSDQLKELGFPLLRLKTGTPPRLRAATIDFSAMERQEGDNPPQRFSFGHSAIVLPQVPCYLTYTNPHTHRLIQENLTRSPLYSGRIQGIGPRYCPSIEDKVVKFPEKTRHALFFEPESLDSDWIYPNGVSTSLPPEVQEVFLRTIPGCRDVEFVRYGYAVEYDCVDPRELKPSLETKRIEGLFLAGQVNGTSGYEEAAIQGLLAGINAGQRALGLSSMTFSRGEAYLGVLVDDLTSRGITEPYRMFTSRAEFRLCLREDNADLRLRQKGYELGLVGEDDYRAFLEKQKAIHANRAFLSKTVGKPTIEVQAALAELGSSPLHSPQPLAQILRRPEVSLADLKRMFHVELLEPLSAEGEQTLEIEIKYEGYIAIQKEEIQRLQQMSGLSIPEHLDYAGVIGLSTEIRQKLQTRKPKTLAEVAQISGVTPTAMAALLAHLRSLRYKGAIPAHPTL